MIYKGSCHCGKIAYEVDAEMGEAIECNCSNCSRRGYMLWFLPRSKLTLLTPESGMAHYTFNTHRIRHYFCHTCGSTPFGMGKGKDGAETVAVNLRCLEGIDLKSLKIKHVDGRSL
ncbi:MAG: GFA family protein [Gammaproteobacteria bacterium]